MTSHKKIAIFTALNWVSGWLKFKVEFHYILLKFYHNEKVITLNESQRHVHQNCKCVDSLTVLSVPTGSFKVKVTFVLFFAKS